MTTSTDGAPPSVAPEPDGGARPAGDSGPRRGRERPERDDAEEAADAGSSWLREEIERRIAEGRSRSGGRHARRDSVSPGSVGYVPRHSVATPGPGAPRPGPVGGSPSPHASELLRRERTAADRDDPAAPTAWSGPPGGPGTAPAPQAPRPSPSPRPQEADGPGPGSPGSSTGPAGTTPVSGSSVAAVPPAVPPAPAPRPRPAPAARNAPAGPAPAPARAPAPVPPAPVPPADAAPDSAATTAAPDAADPGAEPDVAGSAPADVTAQTSPVPTAPRRGRPAGPAWLGGPPAPPAPAGPAAPAPEAPAPADEAVSDEPAPDAGPSPAAAIQVTAPTAPVRPGAPVLGDPVFTARTPEPGSREWQVAAPVRVPEQRGTEQGGDAAGADDPNDLQSRRVRVVLAERRGVASPVRTVVDIQEGTGVGEFLRNDLIKTQLSIALRFAAGAALALGLLPLLFAVLPEIGRMEVLGIRLPWLVLGLLVYPFLFGIGLWYSRLAEKVEQNFADHVQD